MLDVIEVGLGVLVGGGYFYEDGVGQDVDEFEGEVDFFQVGDDEVVEGFVDFSDVFEGVEGWEFGGFDLVFFLFDFVEVVFGAGGVDELSDLLMAALAAGAGAAVFGDLLDSFEVIITDGIADCRFANAETVADQFVLVGRWVRCGLRVIVHEYHYNL